MGSQNNLVLGTAIPGEGSITFDCPCGGAALLELCPDGAIKVRGQTVVYDIDVVEALRHFILCGRWEHSPKGGE